MNPAIIVSASEGAKKVVDISDSRFYGMLVLSLCAVGHRLQQTC